MALVLVLSMVSSAFAAGFSDIQGHWGQSVIEKWAGKGYAKGYPDGTFRPDNIVTRAEFCAFANRFFGYFGYSKDPKDMGVKSSFPDVQVNTGATGEGWYYHDVAVAAAVGYIQGYPDGTFKPNQTMTREEVAYALGKLFGANLVNEVGGVVGTVDNTLDSVVEIAGLGLVDLSGVVPDLKPIVVALLSNGIIKGVLDTVTGLISFDPGKPVTRAMVIQIMDNIFIQFPELLDNGNLLTTVLGVVGGLTGTVVQTVGGVLNTVTGLLDGLTGAGGAVAEDPSLVTNPGAVTGVVTGLLGGVLGGLNLGL